MPPFISKKFQASPASVPLDCKCMSNIQADVSVFTSPDTNIASPRLYQGADVVIMHEHLHKSGKISLCLHAVPVLVQARQGKTRC